jgi:hypothetical protein
LVEEEERFFPDYSSFLPGIPVRAERFLLKQEPFRPLLYFIKKEKRRGKCRRSSEQIKRDIRLNRYIK